MHHLPRSKSAFLVLGAGTPWVHALSAALVGRGHFVHAVAPFDWLNYRRLRPVWPKREASGRLRRDFWVLPPGYVGRLERLFRPLMRWRVRRALAGLRRRSSDAVPWIIVPYPWFGEMAKGVPDTRLVYYNLDDYTLYQPKHTDTILRREADLISRATLTLCLSQTQTQTLRTRYPARVDAIRHFPLGVAATFLNPRPGAPPEPNTVGFTGSLLDRVDWQLVRVVATALPNVQFVFAGGTDAFSGGGCRPDWQAERAAVLELPNVRSVGWLTQEEVRQFYWNCAVNWIPYATDHAFNVAACPTKIMDALAAGRPVLSTNIPECKLYPDWIATVQSAAEMIALLRRRLAVPPDVRAARRQVEFARKHIWEIRARELDGWLRDVPATSLSARLPYPASLSAQ